MTFIRNICTALAIVVAAGASAQTNVTLADPTVYVEDGKYYLYGTWGPNSNIGFPVYTSTDMEAWLPTGSLALTPGDAFGTKGFWAPQVIKRDGRYYMFYTADECIAYATSDSPAGPFTGGAKYASDVKQIDPFVFFDNDGTPYMYHVRVSDGANRIFVARLSDDLKTMDKSTLKKCIEAAPGSWEDTQSVKWTVTEGPTVIRQGDTYYMFYSANDFRNPDYCVGVATATSPYGPWTKSSEPIIHRSAIGLNGTGHGDLFVDSNGDCWYVFHTHFSNNTVAPRQTAIVKLDPTTFKPDIKTFRILKAQINPELSFGVEILTPEGVKVTTEETRSFDMAKNIVVAGSKEKGYKTYFTADDGTHGEELWATDGTVAGTMMVKDIYPGSVSSRVSYITRFNDKVVFSAKSNEQSGLELWISDGTAEGTYMLLDINDLGGSNPQGFVQLNENQFVFSAIDRTSYGNGRSPQHWLYVSDGTAEGTRLIKDCNVKYPGSNTENDRTHFVRVGRKVFFKADTNDGKYGETLWVTDGTTDGTIMLTDINTTVVDKTTGATAGARIDWMTNFQNKKLFFSAYSAEYGQEPWVSDGTPEGTYMIKDLTTGKDANGLPRGSGAFTATPMGDYVYFRGYDPVYGMELFRTDFTDKGTTLVADLNRVPNGSRTNDGNPDLLCVYDGVLFLKAQSGVNASYSFCKGIELFYSDGTKEGTKMQSDLNPGTEGCAAWEGIVASGSMYFRGQNKKPYGENLWELFRIDNKDELPVKVADLGFGQDFVHTLRNMCGDIYFTSRISPRLFKYSYRKDGYDPVKDLDAMDPVFDAEDAGVEAVGADGNDADITIIYNGSYLQFVTSDDILDVTIFDISGRTVLNRRDGSHSLHIGSDGLGCGHYVVKVVTASGTVSKQIVVI